MRQDDQRYMEIGSKSTDARLPDFPTRSSTPTRSLSQYRIASQSRTSSLKRESTHSSRSPSPSRTVATIPDELSSVTPEVRRGMNKTMRDFAANVFQYCTECIITGKGNYYNTQGPGLEAAHVVPQSQWNVFPIDGGLPDPTDLAQLKLAWLGTWE